MELIQHIHAEAKKANKTIVLPEGTEERTLKAADYVLKNELAKIILLGNLNTINALAEKWSLNHISKATIIDPIAHNDKKLYADMLYELRKTKGLTPEQSLKLVEDPLYLATLIIKNKKADGEVAGADNSTGDVLRPAFQIIKTLPGISAVSGAFIMILKNKDFAPEGMLVFAD